MDAQRWQRVADIFLAVVDLNAAGRAGYLEKNTDGDAELRRQVEVLLASHEGAGDFLDIPPALETPRRQPGPRSAASEARRLGDYELIEEIAAGGMGVVFKARQVSLNRIVALKTIVGGPLASRSMVERFRTEAEAAGNLNHPNIVPIYEVGEHDGGHYYSMRLIEGGSLQDRLDEYALPANEEPPPSKLELATRQSRIAHILSTIARAVHYAHQHGILHRDLKPANILLEPTGEPLISDFGIAKLLTGERQLTRTATAIGTPNYMAPEQAAGGFTPLTTATDVFSLGAILYQLLTRKLPFQGATPLETLRRVIDQAPPAPRSVNRSIDRDLETICLKALNKDPLHRYGSASAFADDLDAWRRGEPIAARPVSPPERLWRWCQRKPILALLSAGLIVSIVAGVVIASWQWQRARQTAVILAQNLYVADVGLAYGAWESGNIERARLLLDGQRPRPGNPDLRTFEWRYLFGVTRPQELLTIRSASKELWGSAVSPDGHLLATGSGDGKIQLWDLPTGAAIGTLQASHSIIYCIAFSPDGSLLADATDTTEAHLWDVATRKLIARFSPPRGPVISLVFSTDGRTLATMGGYPYATDVAADVSLWDVGSRQKVGSLAGHTSSVGWMSFSPDDRLLAMPQGNGTITIWNVPSRTMAATLTGHTGLVVCARFSPDGELLASGGLDGTVRLWRVATREMIGILGSHQGAVYTVAFSASGDRLVSGGLDHTVRLWDVRARRPVGVLRGHTSRVFSVSYAHDGRSVISASLDGTAKVWSSQDAPETDVFDRHTGNAATVEFSNDGRLLTRSDPAGDRITIWNARTLAKLADLPHRNSGISPDSRLLATTSADALTLWDVTESAPKLVTNIGLAKAPVLPPIFSPDGRTLALGFADGAGDVSIWDVSRREKRTTLVEPGDSAPVRAYAFARDGRSFVTGQGNGRVRVWDAHAWTPLTLLPGHSQAVQAMVFSPDGRLLATGSADTTVQIWTTDFRSSPVVLRGDGGAVTTLAFAPDGQTLAVGSVDAIVKFWNIRTAREVATIKAHSSVVWSLAFAPDGRTLATSSVDQTMRLWKAPAFGETDR